MKIPTQQDFDNYRGGNTANKWRTCPVNWRCPTCNRTLFELLTWTKSRTRYPWLVPAGGYQWLAPLHEHHDHGKEFNRIPRFPKILVCGDCNAAEGLAKKQFNLPEWFSFSPAEMRYFIIGFPHNRVAINRDRVREVIEYLYRTTIIS